MVLDDPFTTAPSSSDNNADLKSELPALQDRLAQLGASFKARLQTLLGDLAYQPDVDMRFLGVSMNFNDVYQPVRRRKGPAAGATVVGGAAANTSRA